MKTYRVAFQPLAKLHFYEAAIWWAENRSVEQAAKWVDGFQAAIDGLARNPERHSLARENDALPFTVRQLLFGVGRRPTHRALFHIEDDTVHVFEVRHVAERDITEEDLTP